MSDNIKVVVKVRPLISREIDDNLTPQWRVSNNTLYQLDHSGRDFGQCFTFDKVYDQDTKTSDVFEDVAKPIVQAATAGINGTIFAYGQTSSGKTYTMMGTEEAPGIIPLSVLHLFDIIKNIPDRDFLVRVSYIEIYNETVKDLLDIKKDNIKIQEDYEGCIKVLATEEVKSSPEEVLQVMKEGEVNRQTGSTNMNDKSSRSHSLFQITIESREHMDGTGPPGCVNVSQLNLVDLAGSERAGQTGATGLRFKEGTHINKSLSSLALVIKNLSEDPNKYINYRDSKLTRILKNSLGGNAKTSIICAVTPAALDETISTLQFATRAKCIKNKPEVNAVATDATMIQRLTKELSKLQSQLETKKNLEVMLENKKHVEQDLQNKIANLQRLILNGFGQRSNIEQMSGARKKPAPRRITISTLHAIDEDSIPTVPQFCTPTLKYNPLTVQRPDFVPIASGSKLESLPEEPRLVTPPPPKTKQEYFGGDIIEIDSDDEKDTTNSSAKTCSPYHVCFNRSRTPPCILRRNCLHAEKEHKEIVELTRREQLFPPEVVELMEKLDESRDLTVKLRDEIDVLTKRSKEKDLETEHLLYKIKKKEEEIQQIRVELESCNKELTDREVSYDILKKKAALREKELLSLLEEQKVKRAEDIGKLPPKPMEKDAINFLDMSKDISLVNSDNESSIIISNEDETNQLKTLVSNLQDQLIAKSQTIMQLEANIESQKKSIEFLEQSSHELEICVASFQEKNANMEQETKMYKEHVDQLNHTIESQKLNLKKARDDLAMYNESIQELQIKLTEKDDLLHNIYNCDNSENIVANEEKIAANNDNIKNIINSFKLALQNRDAEIERLKMSIITNKSEKETIQEEVAKLKEIVNTNINTVNNLMREKLNFAGAEKELIEKVSELELKILELEDLNQTHVSKIDNLNEINENLVQLLAEKTKKEQEYEQLNSELHKKLNEMSNNMCKSEEDIHAKNKIITELNKLYEEKKECENHARETFAKLKNLVNTLSGDIIEVPELFEDFISIFKILSSSCSVLENVIAENLSQKNMIAKENDNLTCKINNYEKEKMTLLNEIKELQHVIETNVTDIASLKEENNTLLDKINSHYTEETNIKTEQINAFKNQIDKLNNDLMKEQNIVLLLKEKETALNLQISKLETQLEQSNICNRNQMEDVLTKLCVVAHKLEIKPNVACEGNGDGDNYNNVLNLLDKLKNRDDLAKFNETTNVLIQNLSKDKENLLNAVAELTNENKILKINNFDTEDLREHLVKSNMVLEQLKEDLKNKVGQIQDLENKILAYKTRFDNTDKSINRELNNLRCENEKLKACYQSSNDNEQRQFRTKSKHDINCDTNKPHKTITPPSLLTICCHKIADVMELNENCSSVESPLTSDIDIRNINQEQNCPNCDFLSNQLQNLQQENRTLIENLERTEKENKELLIEHEKIRHEVQLLLEPAQELQKKLLSHKTNLSILTATSYAENRSLKSQVLALTHHHSRLLNACQVDIPEFKKQLQVLKEILKDDYNNQNYSANLKRYSLPDVLDNNAASCNFKNESTLDGDLLMLDTNVTLTTTGDNTLVGCNQTCLDLTQTMFNETASQTCDFNKSELNTINQTNFLETHGQIMVDSLDVLQKENCDLKDLVRKLKFFKSTDSKVDAQCSPFKLNKIETPDENTQKMKEEIKRLIEKLDEIESEKQDIQSKYDNLALEIPNTDALVTKLGVLQREHDLKSIQIEKLSNQLGQKNKELNRLLEENDSLSTQVMDNLSEIDDLSKELTKLKLELESIRQFKCPKCQFAINEATASIQKADSPHAKLNRSLSDSESSSRINKICTLQSEIYAGREDCKVLTEQVATIKQHLKCSSSMDLDESMSDPTASVPKNEILAQQAICSLPNIQEEQSKSQADRMECYNYYLEVTGTEKEIISNDMKTIDILKMLYKSILEKHQNEMTNLMMKLKDVEESKSLLQSEFDALASKYSDTSFTLEEKENLDRVLELLSEVKCNTKRLKNDIADMKNSEDLDRISNRFKTQFLKILDYEFGTTSTYVFETILRKAREIITFECSQELIATRNALEELKNKQTEMESEIDLLKARKDRLQEISRAVTLDIVKNEKDVILAIKEGCAKLQEAQLISPNLVLSESAVSSIVIIFDDIIKQSKSETCHLLNKNLKLTLEVNNMKEKIEANEKELIELKAQVESLRDVNNNISTDLTNKERTILTLKTEHENLIQKYDSQLQDNMSRLKYIEELTKEIVELRQTVQDLRSNMEIERIQSVDYKNILLEKENVIGKMHNEIQSLQGVHAQMSKEIARLGEETAKKESIILSLNEESKKTAELKEVFIDLRKENDRLTAANETLSKDCESYIRQLANSNETIKQSKAEIERMTSDILILRESVKDSTSMIESLKQDIQTLTAVKVELEVSLEEKKRECLRLEMNIKTHERTAQLQSKMINRLNNQKQEDDRVISESRAQINEVSEKYKTLQQECELLKNAKLSLEGRVMELETEKGRVPDGSDVRRRRHSLHDSRRVLEQLDEQSGPEEVFGCRQKTDDFFADYDSSGRSTPLVMGKGRDSLLSRTDPSDKDEEPSRPSSVLATRRRRQSAHDLHRGVPRHTPSPHDLSSRIDENHFRDGSLNKSDSKKDTHSDESHLREQLSSCQKELEELKERCRELDEECEECANCLREREALCAKLKKEKIGLEKQIQELKSAHSSSSKPTVSDVAVNTDEDWANLHSVVVDRMSYDAEVEKNKRLTKTIEELRFQKQDLKNIVDKMQRALEKQQAGRDNRELEATKKELKAMRCEIEALRVRNKELDDECETCAQYLKEREEQCRRLKEAKAVLESKLKEFQEDSQALAHYSARKKRQTIHDLNRNSVLEQSDASTETNQDLVTSTSDEKMREIERLKTMVDTLTHQKCSLEQQLKLGAAQPMYVATGSAIVQNQQITDVMKENQKLKKMNVRLLKMCNKRGNTDNRENEDPCQHNA